MAREIHVVDPVTKRDLIILLYRILEDRKPNYGMMHKAAKALQDLLERKYGCTLGYKFNDVSIYRIWDDKFQEDIERYDAVAKMVDNTDIDLAKGYYTHELKLREKTKFLLDTVSRENLEEKFGNLEQLVQKIEKEVRKILEQKS